MLMLVDILMLEDWCYPAKTADKAMNGRFTLQDVIVLDLENKQVSLQESKARHKMSCYYLGTMRLFGAGFAHLSQKRRFDLPICVSRCCLLIGAQMSEWDWVQIAGSRALSAEYCLGLSSTAEPPERACLNRLWIFELCYRYFNRRRPAAPGAYPSVDLPATVVQLPRGWTKSASW